MAYNDKPTVLNAWVTSASAGDNTLVAAVSGLSYKVLGFCTASTAAQTITFKSGTTEISGGFTISANRNINMSPVKDMAWAQTAKGEALVVNFGSAVAGTMIQVMYEIV